MLKTLLSAILVLTTVYFTSCDKKDKPGNKDTYSPPSWIDYTGKAPFSVTYNDTDYVVDTTQSAGYQRLKVSVYEDGLNIYAYDYSEKFYMNVNVPVTARRGDEFDLVWQTTSFLSFSKIIPGGTYPVHWSSSGKCFIVNNTDTEIEGYFYGDAVSAYATDTAKLRKGYFKLKK